MSVAATQQSADDTTRSFLPTRVVIQDLEKDQRVDYYPSGCIVCRLVK
jgi:hypothetical protein